MSLLPENITKEKIENISNQTGFKIVDTYKKIEELGEEFKDSFKHIGEFLLLRTKMEYNQERLNKYNELPILYSIYEYAGSIYYTMFGIYDFLAEVQIYKKNNPNVYEISEEYYNKIISIRNEIIEDMKEIGVANLVSDNIPCYKMFDLSNSMYYYNSPNTLYMSYYWNG